MQRSSKAQTAAVWLLYLCKTSSLSTSSKWNMSFLPINRILIWFDRLLTISLETVFTKSTTNPSLEMTAPAPCKPLLMCGAGMSLGSFAHPLYRELKHLFIRCDSRANSTHSARAKVCKLRVQTHFPSQDYISKHLTRWMQCNLLPTHCWLLWRKLFPFKVRLLFKGWLVGSSNITLSLRCHSRLTATEKTNWC